MHEVPRANPPTATRVPTARGSARDGDGPVFAPAALARGLSRRWSALQMLVTAALVGVMLAVAAAWVLMHLPRVELAAGPGGGLAVSNRGLPLSKATITVKHADGTATVVDAGRLGRGECKVPLPSSVNTAGVRTLVVEGELMGLTVVSVSVVEGAEGGSP